MEISNGSTIGQMLFYICAGSVGELPLHKLNETQLCALLALLEAGQQTIQEEQARRTKEHQRKKLRAVK